MDWQGKTKEQIQNSTILVGLSVLGFILGIVGCILLLGVTVLVELLV